ncbi:LAMI_0G05886g1_1 [Lachancea mirantina]|uniref:LAMI_0G05886g1_1 n=1 Tax=Lachancea mirantina TaxID=1230905 RepID=A0A1G4K8X5_9SACH|nr:LAMI_0G05886g1_1 [Lachancea mirantina]
MDSPRWKPVQSETGNRTVKRCRRSSAMVPAATIVSKTKRELEMEPRSSHATRADLAYHKTPWLTDIPAVTQTSHGESYSFYSAPAHAQLSPVQVRRLSSEQLFNEMEKEQDAIVLRLLREIEYLKDENTRLRNHASENRLSRPTSPNWSSSMSTLCVNCDATRPTMPQRKLSSTSSSDSTHSRRNSSITPIDTVTPTLHLQRKRNSATSNDHPASEDLNDMSNSLNDHIHTHGPRGYVRRRSSSRLAVVEPTTSQRAAD